MHTQVTDRAAAALSLKADGEEVNELRLSMKAQFSDVRAAANQGAGRGRLSYTTGAGHTLCLSCDQPLARLRGHAHEPLAPQGQDPNTLHDHIEFSIYVCSAFALASQLCK